jgi:hypothetical protein
MGFTREEETTMWYYFGGFLAILGTLVTCGLAISAFKRWRQSRKANIDFEILYAFRSGLIAPENKNAYFSIGMKGLKKDAFWLGQRFQKSNLVSEEAADHDELVTVAIQAVGYDVGMSIPLNAFPRSVKGRAILRDTLEAKKVYKQFCARESRRGAKWCVLWFAATLLGFALLFEESTR